MQQIPPCLAGLSVLSQKKIYGDLAPQQKEIISTTATVPTDDKLRDNVEQQLQEQHSQPAQQQQQQKSSNNDDGWNNSFEDDTRGDNDENQQSLNTAEVEQDPGTWNDWGNFDEDFEKDEPQPPQLPAQAHQSHVPFESGIQHNKESNMNSPSPFGNWRWSDDSIVDEFNQKSDDWEEFEVSQTKILNVSKVSKFEQALTKKEDKLKKSAGLGIKRKNVKSN